MEFLWHLRLRYKIFKVTEVLRGTENHSTSVIPWQENSCHLLKAAQQASKSTFSWDCFDNCCFQDNEQTVRLNICTSLKFHIFQSENGDEWVWSQICLILHICLRKQIKLLLSCMDYVVYHNCKCLLQLNLCCNLTCTSLEISRLHSQIKSL